MLPNCDQQVIYHNGVMGQFVPFKANPMLPGVQDQMQQMQRPQQMPPQPQFTGLPGRVVMKEDDIRPNEVPAEGAGIFPLADGSAIYLKTWNKEGTIDTQMYTAVIESKPVVPNSDSIREMRQEIQERFDKLEKLYSRQKNYHPKYQKREDGEKNAGH